MFAFSWLRWLLLIWLLLRCLLLGSLLLVWRLFGWLLLAFNINKTPSRETGCLGNPYFLLIIYPYFVTCPSLCSVCMTYRTLYHSIDHQVLPTQPLPKEAEDILRGDRYLSYVYLFTCLIYFSSRVTDLAGSIYVLGSPQWTLINLSLVLNQSFKSPMSR